MLAWPLLISLCAVALVAALGVPLLILITHRAYARGVIPAERDPE